MISLIRGATARTIFVTSCNETTVRIINLLTMPDFYVVFPASRWGKRVLFLFIIETCRPRVK